MIGNKRYAVLLIGLLAVSSCQATSTPLYEPERDDHQEYEEVYSGEVDDESKQGLGLLAIALPLIIGFIRPLLSNLGIGMTNAVFATMLRKRLSVLPVTRLPQSSPGRPSPVSKGRTQ